MRTANDYAKLVTLSCVGLSQRDKSEMAANIIVGESTGKSEKTCVYDDRKNGAFVRMHRIPTAQRLDLILMLFMH